jgi:hypothetical protein
MVQFYLQPLGSAKVAGQLLKLRRDLFTTLAIGNRRLHYMGRTRSPCGQAGPDCDKKRQGETGNELHSRSLRFIHKAATHHPLLYSGKFSMTKGGRGFKRAL